MVDIIKPVCVHAIVCVVIWKSENMHSLRAAWLDVSGKATGHVVRKVKGITVVF